MKGLAEHGNDAGAYFAALAVVLFLPSLEGAAKLTGSSVHNLPSS